MKNQLNKLHYIQLSRRLLPSVKGDPKKIALANQCLQKLDNHFLKKIDSIDSHKTYINALYYSLPLLEEFDQYVDPAYMRGLMDSMAFLELHLSDNTTLKAYAEKAALILDMYINVLFTRYMGKEISKEAALDFCSQYITKIDNYFAKAGFIDHKNKGSVILRNLYQEKANHIKEKVNFLRSAFQTHADRHQQMIDKGVNLSEQSSPQGQCSQSTPLLNVNTRVDTNLLLAYKIHASVQTGSRYSFHDSLHSVNVNSNSNSNNKALTCRLM